MSEWLRALPECLPLVVSGGPGPAQLPVALGDCSHPTTQAHPGHSSPAPPGSPLPWVGASQAQATEWSARRGSILTLTRSQPCHSQNLLRPPPRLKRRLGYWPHPAQTLNSGVVRNNNSGWRTQPGIRSHNWSSNSVKWFRLPFTDSGAGKQRLQHTCGLWLICRDNKTTKWPKRGFLAFPPSPMLC